MISLGSTRVAGGRAGSRRHVSQRELSSRVETRKSDSKKLFFRFSNFPRQFEDWRYVGILRTSDVEISNAFSQAVCDRDRVFRNVDAQRVAILGAKRVVHILQRHLTFAREIPVDEHARRIRMRRAIEKT